MFYSKTSSGLALTLFALASMGSVSAEEIRFEQVKDPIQLKEGMSYMLVGQWADPDNPGFTRYYVMGSYSQTDDPAGRPALEVKLSVDGNLYLSSDMIADGLASSEEENKALLLDLSSNHYYYFGYGLTAHGTKSKLYGYGTSLKEIYGSAAQNACLPLLSSGSIQTGGWDIEFTPRRWYYAWDEDFYYGIHGIDINEYPEELEGTVNLVSKYHRPGSNNADSFSSIVFVRTDEGQAYFCGGKSGTAPDEKGIQHIVTNTLLFRQECDHPNLQTYSEEPDCYSSGVSEIWYCDKCDEYFVDKTCTKPTTPEDHYIQALGHSYGKDGICQRCNESNQVIKWVDLNYSSWNEDVPNKHIIVAEKDGKAYAMTNQTSVNGLKAVPISMDDQRRIFAPEDNLVIIASDDWGGRFYYHEQQLYFNTAKKMVRFRKDYASNWNSANWGVTNVWNTYSSINFSGDEGDYYLALVPDVDGGYCFEPVIEEAYNTIPEEERLHVFQSSCLHEGMTYSAANEPTCEKFGNIEFWYCRTCEVAYRQYSDTKEVVLIEDDEHTTTIPALRHHYEEGSTTCTHCGEEAPIYRRVEHQTQFAEGGRYLLGAEVDGKVYLLGSYDPNIDADGNPIKKYDPTKPDVLPTIPAEKIEVMVEVQPEADGSIRANNNYLERLRPKRLRFMEDSWVEDESGNWYPTMQWNELWNLVTNDFNAWAHHYESLNTYCRTYDQLEKMVFHPGKDDYFEGYDYMAQTPYGEGCWLNVDVYEDRPDIWRTRYHGSEWYEEDEDYFYSNVPISRQHSYSVLLNQPWVWDGDSRFDFAYYHGLLPSDDYENEEEESDEDVHLAAKIESTGKIMPSEDYETNLAADYPLVLYYMVEEPLTNYVQQKQEVIVEGEELSADEVADAVTNLIIETGLLPVDEDGNSYREPEFVSSVNLANATLADGMTGEQLFAGVNKAVEATSEVGYNLVASQNLVIVVPAESAIQGTNIINDGVCQNLELTDLQPLSLPDDIEAAQFAFSRNFKHNWGTLMLPVSIAVPTDLVAQQLADVDIENRTICFDQVDALTANVPVIIRAKGVSGSDFRGQQVTVSTSKPAEKMAFEGTYRDIYGSEAESRGLYVLNSNNEFVPAGSNTHIAPFRAYLKVDSGELSYAPLRLQVDETTGLLSANGQHLLKVTVIPGGLNLLGEAGTEVIVRNVEGKVCAQLTLSGDEQDVQLPAGAYLVNNSRVVVK